MLEDGRGGGETITEQDDVQLKVSIGGGGDDNMSLKRGGGGGGQRQEGGEGSQNI